jgi:protein-disulfide isomerase-like protein with CxxC motif
MSSPVWKRDANSSLRKLRRIVNDFYEDGRGIYDVTALEEACKTIRGLIKRLDPKKPHPKSD